MKLREALQGKIPANALEQTNTSFDTIGDIAILELDEELREYMPTIAQTLLELHKNIRVVVRKASEHEGELRIQTYEHLAGEKRTETIAKENGLDLYLDINETYYSPRSQNERLRIINHVQPGERVLVMYSGIGPFTLGIAKNTQASEVIGVELNKQAHKYAQHNTTRNKAMNVKNHCADVQEAVSTLGRFDRVIMPLPHTAYEHLQLAANATTPGGIIHLYCFATPEDVSEDAHSYAQHVRQELVVKEITKSGTYNPAVNRWCIDYTRN